MNSKKLIIYLDSSSYSDLSNIRALEKTQELYLKELKAYILENIKKIDIISSSVILLEIINGDNEKAINRSELNEILCKGKTFIPPHELWSHDIINIINKKKLPIFNENNNWLNLKEKNYNFFLSFEDDIVKAIKIKIKNDNPHLPRKARRKKEGKYIKNGKIIPESFNEIMNNIDLKFLSKEKVISFLKGKISQQDFSENFVSNAISPSSIIKYSTLYNLPMQDAMKKVSKDYSDILNDSITKIIQLIIHELDEQEINLQLIEKAFCLSNIRENFILSSIKKYMSSFCEEKINEIVKSKIGSIPSFDFFISVLRQFFLEKIKNKETFKKIRNGESPAKSSDFADLLHLSYAPHCDIMCVDKRTYDLIQKLPKDFKLKFNTVFVKNLKDLKQNIDDKLKYL